MEQFGNVYEDSTRAQAYAQLEFPGTYYLAFRDLPELFKKHVRGKRALDFGCGAGRSSRFLESRGFTTIGVDISAAMLAQARQRAPRSDYRLVTARSIGEITERFDLILAAFTFDNIPTDEAKLAALTSLRGLLAAVRIIMLDVPDRRPVDDVLCSDRQYRQLFGSAGLAIRDMIQPLAKGDEGIAWVSETHTAAWSVYVLDAA